MAGEKTTTTAAGAAPATDEERHQQMIEDGKPLESPEAAAAAFEELAAEITGEAAPAGRPAAKEPAGSTQAPAPQPTPQPTPTPVRDEQLQGLTREELDALRALPNAVKTIGGRVAAMQGELTKIGTKAASTVTGDGKEAPTAAAIAAAAGDTAKWDKLAKDFPEWGEAINQRLEALGAKAPPVDIEAIRKQAREDAVAEAKALIEEQREADIAEDHPDWKAKLKSQPFVDWFNSQEQAYRTRLYNSNSARAISGMLTKFDLDTTQQSQQQSSSTAPAHAAAVTTTAPAIDLAAAVTKRGGSAPRAPSEADLSGKELWDHLAAKETAK